VTLSDEMPQEPETDWQRLARTLKVSFGENLRRARVQKHMTQIDLSQSCGITQQDVSAFERGGADRNPTLETLCRLAIAVGIDPLRLMSPVLLTPRITSD
jgi:transcriptional regulator with XRE-family HTH domain